VVPDPAAVVPLASAGWDAGLVGAVPLAGVVETGAPAEPVVPVGLSESLEAAGAPVEAAAPVVAPGALAGAVTVLAGVELHDPEEVPVAPGAPLTAVVVAEVVLVPVEPTAALGVPVEAPVVGAPLVAVVAAEVAGAFVGPLDPGGGLVVAPDAGGATVEAPDVAELPAVAGALAVAGEAEAGSVAPAVLEPLDTAVVPVVPVVPFDAVEVPVTLDAGVLGEGHAAGLAALESADESATGIVFAELVELAVLAVADASPSLSAALGLRELVVVSLVVVAGLGCGTP
jgi:hypothetical protein